MCTVPIRPVKAKQPLSEEEMKSLLAMTPAEVSALTSNEKRQRTRTINRFREEEEEKRRQAQKIQKELCRTRKSMERG